MWFGFWSRIIMNVFLRTLTAAMRVSPILVFEIIVAKKTKMETKKIRTTMVSGRDNIVLRSYHDSVLQSLRVYISTKNGCLSNQFCFLY
jgi:hypothetical protein